MKKRIRSKKLISSLAISTLVLGLFVTTVINADETEVSTEPEIQEVEEMTEKDIIDEEQEVIGEGTVDEMVKTVELDISSTSEAEQVGRSSLVRVDLTANAFPESSRPLEQAIISTYNGTNGTIKVDTDDNGYISFSEANLWNGTLIYLNGDELDNRLSGTISGIENFTKLRRLILPNNNLSGNLPDNIGNLTELRELSFGGYLGNQLTGDIPISFGNLTNLTTLSLSNNQFTGTLDNLGTLVNLTSFSASNNQFTGGIPASFMNMTELTIFMVDNNNLTGEIPSWIATSYINLNYLFLGNNNFTGNVPSNLGQLSKVTQIDIASNPLLTGDITTIFETTPMLKYLNIAGTKTSQIKPNNNSIIVFLFDVLQEDGSLRDDFDQEMFDELIYNLEAIKTLRPTNDYSEGTKDSWVIGSIVPSFEQVNEVKKILSSQETVDNLFVDEAHTDIIDGLIQADIDNAQNSVNVLAEGEEKNKLQKEIDKAQNMLNAKEAVEGLFTDGTHTDITDGLTQKDIDKAQDAVDKLPDGTLKDELQKEIDKAQDMLNAKDAVGDLLDKDGNLNSGVTQDDINKAQDLVNKLPDGDLKDELQAIIDEAQRQLDAQNVKNPSTAPTTNKPSLSATSTTGGDNVNTADTTNLSLYLGLLAISLGGIVLMKRKKANAK